MEMNRKENKRTPANFNIVNSGGGNGQQPKREH